METATKKQWRRNDDKKQWWRRGTENRVQLLFGNESNQDVTPNEVEVTNANEMQVKNLIYCKESGEAFAKNREQKMFVGELSDGHIL